MTIHIASIFTKDCIARAYLLLNSIKKNKKPNTNIQYYLFVPFEPDFPEAAYIQYLQELTDESLKITVRDVNQFKDCIKAPHTIVYYVRYLFPQIFPELDKIIHIDASDAFCIGPGIEDFWNLDLAGAWLGAVIDPTWQYCGAFKHDPINCGTDHYFNDGIILMNLKNMRADGKDTELAEWCRNWDDTKLRRICFAQTLANYVLKDKVKLINSKYNNTLLASLGIAKNCYAYAFNQEGWIEPLDSLDHAVFVHFCGSKKPWSAKALECSKVDYPYKDEAVELWQELVTKYGKH